MKSKKVKYQKPQLKAKKVKISHFLVKYNPDKFDFLAAPIIFPPVGSG